MDLVGRICPKIVQNQILVRPQIWKWRLTGGSPRRSWTIFQQQQGDTKILKRCSIPCCLCRPTADRRNRKDAPSFSPSEDTRAGSGPFGCVLSFCIRLKVACESNSEQVLVCDLPGLAGFRYSRDFGAFALCWYARCRDCMAICAG